VVPAHRTDVRICSGRHAQDPSAAVLRRPEITSKIRGCVPERQNGPSVGAIATAELPAERTIQDLRILVVDDEPANTRLLERLLSTWGYSDVVTLGDPRDVRCAIEEAAPDLLLLDLHMPHLSGYEVMRDLGAL